MQYDPERHHRRSIRRRGHDYRSGVYFVTINSHEWQPLFARVENGVVHLTTAGALVYDLWVSIPRHFPSVRLDAFVIMPTHLHGILILGQVDWWRGVVSNPQVSFLLTPPTRFPTDWTCPVCQSGVPPALAQRLHMEAAHSARQGNPAPTGAVAVPNSHADPASRASDAVGARFPRPEPTQSPHPAPSDSTGAVPAPLSEGVALVPAPLSEGVALVSAPCPDMPSRIQQPALGQIIAYFKYQTTKRYNQQRLTPSAALWHRNYHERILRSNHELNAFRTYILLNPSRWENAETRFLEESDLCG